MRKFGIREKYNKEMAGELADTIENYIRQIARDKKSAFSTYVVLYIQKTAQSNVKCFELFKLSFFFIVVR